MILTKLTKSKNGFKSNSLRIKEFLITGVNYKLNSGTKNIERTFIATLPVPLMSILTLVFASTKRQAGQLLFLTANALKKPERSLNNKEQFKGG